MFDKSSTIRTFSAVIIVAIVAYAIYDYGETTELLNYDGKYSEKSGIVARSAYIGRKEIFGPKRYEVELKEGGTFILVIEKEDALIEVGDSIVLSVPKEREFLDRGVVMTNKFSLTRVDRITYD